MLDACLFSGDDDPGIDATLAVTTAMVDLTVGETAAARLPDRAVRIALASNTQDALGPCEELARREQSGAGAAAVWSRGDFPVATVADSDPGLVAARAEVANSAPGIDGFVGTALLQAFRVRLDYPGARLLVRCEDAPPDTQPTCATFPRVANR